MSSFWHVVHEIFFWIGLLGVAGGVIGAGGYFLVLSCLATLFNTKAPR